MPISPDRIRTLAIAIDEILITHIHGETEGFTEAEIEYVKTHVAIALLRDLHLHDHLSLIEDKEDKRCTGLLMG